MFNKNFTAISVHSKVMIPSLRQACCLLLAIAFTSVNFTNQTFIIKHRPVAPGWRVSRASVAMCTCTRVTCTCAQFVNLWVLMHGYTCISLLNISGSWKRQCQVCVLPACLLVLLPDQWRSSVWEQDFIWTCVQKSKPRSQVIPTSSFWSLAVCSPRR